MITKFDGVICIGMALFVAAAASAAFAKPPKAGPNGENCIKTGTERREGKDPKTGEKFDCLWDYCKHCKTVDRKIDCSKLVTSYSNPRDCKPVQARNPGTGLQLRPGTRFQASEPRTPFRLRRGQGRVAR